MSHAASAPNVEELVRTVALDAVRRIQDALRFCPHSEVAGLLRALREARDLVRGDAEYADEMETQFIFRDSTGAPIVLETSAHTGSHFESRWLSEEESAAVAAEARAHRDSAEVRGRDGPS